MATTLTRAYLAELKKGENRSNVILEVEFDSGTKRYGYSRGGLNDFTQGLLAIYRLDNDWLATIGGANGTSIGAGFDAVNHKLGIGCGSFNGTGDHVDMGSISGSDVLSFAFWFKPNAAITSASAFQDPVRFGNVGGLYYAAMLGSATSDLTDEIFTIYCRDSANSPAPHGWVDNFFTIDTTWHLVVCVWNSAVNMYDIYFDGDSKTVTNGSTGRTSLP